jgi:hypothetical protein
MPAGLAGLPCGGGLIDNIPCGLSTGTVVTIVMSDHFQLHYVFIVALSQCQLMKAKADPEGSLVGDAEIGNSASFRRRAGHVGKQVAIQNRQSCSA